MAPSILLAPVAAALLLLAALAGPAAAQDSAETGLYPNHFARWNPKIDDDAVDKKLNRYWKSLFEGGKDERIFYPGERNENGPTAYIVDIGNEDVRTEGMSYGMMIAVQMNKKDAFDALWNWATTHMQYKDGARKGYFRWQCQPEGCLNDAVPASDGEEYFATALFFAAHRWGNGDGIYDYESEANAILNVMLHKEDMNGGVVEGVTNMFDRKAHQVVFVAQGPAATFSDPSYHLPAFYELWGRWARGWEGRREADRQFWLDAAAESRRYFDRAAHPETGLTPDYAGFDGAPKALRGHGDFRYDAHRSAVNWSVDYAWWGEDANAPARTGRLLDFLASRDGGYVSEYTLDGAPLSDHASASLIASTGAAAALSGEANPHANEFVATLWELEPPRGKWRYYNGLLQFMGVMHAGGRFRVY